MDRDMSPPSEDLFRAIYARHARPVLGYALRRVDVAEDAADVVAETFLVALRRIADVPHEPDTRAWLFGVARRVLANSRRGDRRRGRLGERLRGDVAAAFPDHASFVATTLDTERLLEPLGEVDREIVRLTAWEELSPSEIAQVLGLTPNAVRLRLSRARRGLRAAAQEPGEPAGPEGPRHEGGAAGHPHSNHPSTALMSEEQS